MSQSKRNTRRLKNHKFEDFRRRAGRVRKYTGKMLKFMQK